MNTIRRNRRQTPKPQSGFTLVEMLVSVGLVLMMMLLFSQIFTAAAGSLSKQRGISENDQRSRMLTMILKRDLSNMTYRPTRVDSETPAVAIRPLAENVEPAEEQKGYLYISENRWHDDADDVLQFTVRLRRNDAPYYGSARNEQPPGSTSGSRPDADDAEIGNDTGTSKYAEVAYFVRNGVLYRRVQLIRDRNDPQPRIAAGQDAMVNYTRNFWFDFDYSAHYFARPAQNVEGAQFHGPQHLNNNQRVALGNPRYRFGFNHATGLPREWVGSNFIGRFTQEETSHRFFRYPHTASQFDNGDLINDGNPMQIGAATSPLQFSDGVVTQYRGGPRQGDDILLTHVLSFDVRVWDSAFGRFVNIGEPGTSFDPSENNNANYVNGGPLPYARNIYDTWHPRANIGGNTNVPFNVALPSLEIVVRFRDPNSDQIRQVTVVHHFR